MLGDLAAAVAAVALPLAGSFLEYPRFASDFKELYAYYKNAQLLQLRVTQGKLLASRLLPWARSGHLTVPRGGVVSGGFSLGHEVTDICAVAGQASVTYAGVAGVLASSAGTLAALVGTPSTLYCHVEPPFQADVKGFVSYPLPWFGLNASARQIETRCCIPPESSCGKRFSKFGTKR